MKTYLDCYPCFIRQALEATRIANQEETVQKTVLNEVMDCLKVMDLSVSPPRQAQVIHRLIRKITGLKDPYFHLKQEHNSELLRLEPRLLDHIHGSPDRLQEALKVAGACNAIDMGPNRTWRHAGEIVDQILNPTLGPFDVKGFKEQLRKSKNMLYIADNAGEIVGDKILLSILKEQPKPEILFAVRGAPILNDALQEDAEQMGIDRMARVITTGADCPGVILSECSGEFTEAFECADLILAKGQGNYETLNESKRNIFFLLQVKCAIVARDMKSTVGQIILRSLSTDEIRFEHYFLFSS